MSAAVSRFSTSLEMIPNGPGRRRRDFIAGRECASRALSLAGSDCASHPIGVRADRSPAWPVGWVGSITHTDGYAAAAVAPRTLLESVGIDSEKVMSAAVAGEVSAEILVPSEEALFARVSLTREEFVTAIFSAKESLYKCLAPVVGRYFDFQDAELVELDPGAGRFCIRLRQGLDSRFPAGQEFSGSVGIREGYVHTALELGASR
jgi:enterobactin synthetase component D